MNFYQEITLIPSPEIPQHFLWEKLFQQIHFELAETKNAEEKTPIGISFPEYRSIKGDHPLGTKLRLFAPNESILQNSNLKKYLERLSDYIHITSIRSVPDKVLGYACYKRRQIHYLNIEERIRHQAERRGVSLAEAQRHFSAYEQVQTDLPFIYMDSLSTKQKRFRLLIEKVLSDRPIQGGFSTYGLSSTSTVPEF